MEINNTIPGPGCFKINFNTTNTPESVLGPVQGRQ